MKISRQSLFLLKQNLITFSYSNKLFYLSNILKKKKEEKKWVGLLYTLYLYIKYFHIYIYWQHVQINYLKDKTYTRIYTKKIYFELGVLYIFHILLYVCILQNDAFAFFFLFLLYFFFYMFNLLSKYCIIYITYRYRYTHYIHFPVYLYMFLRCNIITYIHIRKASECRNNISKHCSFLSHWEDHKHYITSSFKAIYFDFAPAY